MNNHLLGSTSPLFTKTPKVWLDKNVSALYHSANSLEKTAIVACCEAFGIAMAWMMILKYPLLFHGPLHPLFLKVAKEVCLNKHSRFFDDEMERAKFLSAQDYVELDLHWNFQNPDTFFDTEVLRNKYDSTTSEGKEKRCASLINLACFMTEKTTEKIVEEVDKFSVKWCNKLLNDIETQEQKEEVLWIFISLKVFFTPSQLVLLRAIIQGFHNLNLVEILSQDTLDHCTGSSEFTIDDLMAATNIRLVDDFQEEQRLEEVKAVSIFRSFLENQWKQPGFRENLLCFWTGLFVLPRMDARTKRRPLLIFFTEDQDTIVESEVCMQALTLSLKQFRCYKRSKEMLIYDLVQKSNFIPELLPVEFVMPLRDDKVNELKKNFALFFESKLHQSFNKR